MSLLPNLPAPALSRSRSADTTPPSGSSDRRRHSVTEGSEVSPWPQNPDETAQTLASPGPWAASPSALPRSPERLAAPQLGGAPAATLAAAPSNPVVYMPALPTAMPPRLNTLAVLAPWLAQTRDILTNWLRAPVEVRVLAPLSAFAARGLALRHPAPVEHVVVEVPAELGEAMATTQLLTFVAQAMGLAWSSQRYMDRWGARDFAPQRTPDGLGEDGGLGHIATHDAAWHTTVALCGEVPALKTFSHLAALCGPEGVIEDVLGPPWQGPAEERIRTLVTEHNRRLLRMTRAPRSHDIFCALNLRALGFVHAGPRDAAALYGTLLVGDSRRIPWGLGDLVATLVAQRTPLDLRGEPLPDGAASAVRSGMLLNLASDLAFAAPPAWRATLDDPARGCWPLLDEALEDIAAPPAHVKVARSVLALLGDAKTRLELMFWAALFAPPATASDLAHTVRLSPFGQPSLHITLPRLTPSGIDDHLLQLGPLSESSTAATNSLGAQLRCYLGLDASWALSHEHLEKSVAGALPLITRLTEWSALDTLSDGANARLRAALSAALRHVEALVRPPQTDTQPEQPKAAPAQRPQTPPPAVAAAPARAPAPATSAAPAAPPSAEPAVATSAQAHRPRRAAQRKPRAVLPERPPQPRRPQPKRSPPKQPKPRSEAKPKALSAAPPAPPAPRAEPPAPAMVVTAIKPAPTQRRTSVPAAPRVPSPSPSSSSSTSSSSSSRAQEVAVPAAPPVPPARPASPVAPSVVRTAAPSPAASLASSHTATGTTLDDVLAAHNNDAFAALSARVQRRSPPGEAGEWIPQLLLVCGGSPPGRAKLMKDSALFSALCRREDVDAVLMKLLSRCEEVPEAQLERWLTARGERMARVQGLRLLTPATSPLFVRLCGEVLRLAQNANQPDVFDGLLRETMDRWAKDALPHFSFAQIAQAALGPLGRASKSFRDAIAAQMSLDTAGALFKLKTNRPLTTRAEHKGREFARELVRCGRELVLADLEAFLAEPHSQPSDAWWGPCSDVSRLWQTLLSNNDPALFDGTCRLIEAMAASDDKDVRAMLPAMFAQVLVAMQSVSAFETLGNMTWRLCAGSDRIPLHTLLVGLEEKLALFVTFWCDAIEQLAAVALGPDVGELSAAAHAPLAAVSPHEPLLGTLLYLRQFDPEAKRVFNENDFAVLFAAQDNQRRAAYAEQLRRTLDGRAPLAEHPPENITAASLASERRTFEEVGREHDRRLGRLGHTLCGAMEVLRRELLKPGVMALVHPPKYFLDDEGELRQRFDATTHLLLTALVRSATMAYRLGRGRTLAAPLEAFWRVRPELRELAASMCDTIGAQHKRISREARTNDAAAVLHTLVRTETDADKKPKLLEMWRRAFGRQQPLELGTAYEAR